MERAEVLKMSQPIIFLIIGAIGIVIGYYLALSRRSSPERRRTVGRKTKKAGLIARQKQEKEANLQKIREYMRGRESARNEEIEKLLGVSDATATRYMDELEQEGAVKQIGRSGPKVLYKAR